MQFLRKLGRDVVGADYTPSALEVGCAHNPNLNLVHADFGDVPFDDESFNYVVSSLGC